MEEKLQASLVLEILGRPSEHIKEALNTLVVKMGSEQGVKLINKTYHEPVLAQDSKDLFTTFAEVEVELDSLETYFGVLFSYMPSHIEIISPEKIVLQNFHINELGSKLSQRLHDYDAITKGALFEREELAKKLKEVAPHLFKEKKD